MPGATWSKYTAREVTGPAERFTDVGFLSGHVVKLLLNIWIYTHRFVLLLTLARKASLCSE